jgi:hypothetical protein
VKKTVDFLESSFSLKLVNFLFTGMYLYIVLGTLLPEIREQFNEQLRTDMIQAIITTVLQVTGIFIGSSFMYLMNVHNTEI